MATPSKKDQNLPDVYTIEEALVLTKFGIFHYQLLFTCGFCFLTFMSQITCVGLLMPYMCDLPATVKQQSLLASSSFFGVVCSSHLMGFLGDTWGRRSTLKFSLIMCIVFSTMSAFSLSIWMLIVTRFLTGFCVSGCQSCTYSMCGEFHSNKTRSRHVTLISTFLNISLIFNSMLALLILPLRLNSNIWGFHMTSWRYTLLALNTASISTLILICFTPESPKYDLIHGKEDRALKTLQYMFKRNTRRPIEEYPVKSVQLEKTGANIKDIHNCKDAIKMIWKQTIQPFYRERIFHTINICFVLSVLYGVSHGLLMWYPTIVIHTIKRSKENLCQVIGGINTGAGSKRHACNDKVETLTFWIVAFLGCFFTGVYLIFSFTVTIVGKRYEIMIYSIFCGIVAVCVPWVENLAGTAFSLTVISSIGTLGGIVGAIAVEYYPTNISAMAICLTMMIGRLGAAMGSILFGTFLFRFCKITFWVVAAIIFLATFLSWLLPEKKKTNTATVTE